MDFKSGETPKLEESLDGEPTGSTREPDSEFFVPSFLATRLPSPAGEELGRVGCAVCDNVRTGDNRRGLIDWNDVEAIDV